jgi:pimeloyl-ACP methyl ester carboxylesterase
MPLEGAFSGQLPAKPAPTPAPARAWCGPVLQAADLGEATEQSLLCAAGKQALVLPFGSFDPAKEPVVLVHGINGDPEDMQQLAEKLQAAGKQVFVVLYHDQSELTHKSGAALATALSELRANYYAAGTPLDIVAHSMGGIVSRAALNYLQDPGWMQEAPGLASAPRAGFGPVRLRTLDTPWDGFAAEPPGMKFLGPIIEFFMSLFGARGACDMRATSDMFDHLYTPCLEGVDVRNTAARQPDVQDGIRALPDLSQKELAEVAKCLLDGVAPSSPRARNMACALRQDSRCEQLVVQVKQQLAGATDPATCAQALVGAYESVMPRYVGTHLGVIRGSTGDGGPLVDDVVHELCS